MTAPIRLELTWLEALPLDAVARATLWRELLLLQRRAADPAPASQALTLALERRLFAEELDRCRRLCLEGDWLQGGRQLDLLQGLAVPLGEGERLGERLIELLTALHGLLINPAAASETEPAGAAPDGERAELLWQAHRWQRLIATLPVVKPDGLAVIDEQISRYGAIAWHRRARQAAAGAELLQALRRSMTLLLQLAQPLDPCPAWIARSLREGLQLALLAEAEAMPTPAELLDWTRGYIDHALPAAAREVARQHLWPAEAALEVGKALRLPPFHPATGP